MVAGSAAAGSAAGARATTAGGATAGSVRGATAHLVYLVPALVACIGRPTHAGAGPAG